MYDSKRHQSICFGEVPQVLQLLRHLVLERHDIAAVLDDRANRIFFQAVHFLNLLPVSVKLAKALGKRMNMNVRWRKQDKAAIVAGDWQDQ